MLQSILADNPEVRLQAVLSEARATTGDEAAVGGTLRRLKAELHLLTALCDLSGVWDLDKVTGALTRFADASLQAALACAAATERAAGRLLGDPGSPDGPVPGYFCLALGKHGAFELNYSSDIDVSVFYHPESLPLAEGVEPAAFAIRLTQSLTRLMQERTPEGYVFRVDLRLRPDPSSTPIAAPVDMALDYYESVGQNWERAACIKARVAAGDTAAGVAFIAALQPFIWRRHLDYAAIADIHSIKRQIHIHKVDERLTAPGANLKLGAGGIREIEFFVQTQQLIHGGRNPALRARRTLDALAALVEAGITAPKVGAELTAAYIQLRTWEHRVQVVHDEQSHVLPENAGERRRVAVLSGLERLLRFDALVSGVLKRVNRRYGELFAEDEALSSRFGSLVFTGVDDDPETLATLKRMGFSTPPRVSGAIRAWHHGRIGATRTPRGRELFTRLAPRLLDACASTGAADAAFNRFSDFFAGLSSGVQVQSLFLANPDLLGLLVETMAFAPRIAQVLARQPAALDALLDPRFFDAPDDGEAEAAVGRAVRDAPGFEAAMDAARRLARDQSFRIGFQVMAGRADATQAGRATASFADACIAALAEASLAEVSRLGGAFPGAVAVIALGKAGGREMTAASDLDLMTLYSADAPDAASGTKGWSAETFFARFTQRLTAALSAPTGEGVLYPVDLQLRPSGTAGPVAVSLAAFEGYYAREAETWEFLALTRARVAWASDPAFGARAARAIETVLRQPRDAVRAAADVREMRALMTKERPPSGPWDLKLSPGGFVDIEFAAQFLQVIHAGADGPLAVNTGEALEALAAAGLLQSGLASALLDAWRLEQALSQVLKLALGDGADPAVEPAAFRRLLARVGDARDYRTLEKRLASHMASAHRAFEQIVAGRG